MHRSRLIGSVVLALIVTAGAALAKAPPPPKYSLAQQTAAVSALQAALKDLDQLDQRLSPAYGDAPSQVRIEEQKSLSEAPEAPVEKPEKLLKDTGRSLMERLASYDPIISNCSAVGESVYTLSAIARKTSVVLAERKAARADEVARWTDEGGTNGSQRLASVAELNCVTLRAALTGAAPVLQDAYSKVSSVQGVTPEGDPPGSSAPASSAPGHSKH